jgi:hypothetical protein
MLRNTVQHGDVSATPAEAELNRCKMRGDKNHHTVVVRFSYLLIL